MIDAHRHFWRYSPSSHAWIDDSMPMLKHDFLPGSSPFADPRAVGGTSQREVSGCVAVQALHDPAESVWLLELAGRHPEVLGVVGWVDLCAPNAGARLDELAVDAHFVGVRHLLQDEPDPRFCLRADFRRGLHELSVRDLCFDVLVRAPQRDAALELVRAFPAQRFVLDHLLKPRVADRELDPWHRQMHEFARHENVWCKLSGLCTEAERGAWNPALLEPYLDIALETFGPARLVFGSDHPVCLLAGSAQRAVDAHLEFLRRLSPSEYTAITHTNAVHVYGLEP